MFGGALESAKSRGPKERTGGRHHANLAGNHLEVSQTGLCGGRESNLVAFVGENMGGGEYACSWGLRQHLQEGELSLKLVLCSQL